MKRSQIRELFTFTSKERSGIIVLTFFLLLSLAGTYFIPRFHERPNDLTEFSDEIYAFRDNVHKKQVQQETNYPYKEINKLEDKEHVFHLFAFNPNTVNEHDLTKMGFTSSQISNLLNYRNSGGKFYQKSDFLKLYTIDSITFEKLEPYLALENKKAIRSSNVVAEASAKKIHITIPLEINNCSESELQTKLQIPESLAARIIKYRDLLGGFVNFRQLSDVYGFNTNNIDTARIKLSFNPEHIKKIDLNHSDFKKIVSHPYIDKYKTNAILEYRKFMTTIKTLEELKDNNVLTEQDINRLRPYLSL